MAYHVKSFSPSHILVGCRSERQGKGSAHAVIQGPRLLLPCGSTSSTCSKSSQLSQQERGTGWDGVGEVYQTRAWKWRFCNTSHMVTPHRKTSEKCIQAGAHEERESVDMANTISILILFI